MVAQGCGTAHRRCPNRDHDQRDGLGSGGDPPAAPTRRVPRILGARTAGGVVAGTRRNATAARVRHGRGRLHSRPGDPLAVLPEDGEPLRVGVPRGHRPGVHAGGAELGLGAHPWAEHPGVGSWIAATVVVWLVTAVATLLLPMVVL